MPVPGLSARRWRRTVRLAPPAVLMLLYGVLILIGTVLLKLPVAASAPTSWSEALFTAASAVTVTGLIVVDTGVHYTLFGQFVVIVLIQLGGLGLMTFAVLVFAVLGLEMPVRQQLVLREDLNQTDLGNLVKLVWLILRVVLAFEVLGTGLLAVRFVPEFGWGEGLWQALFHAVSAFNNAGFSLFSDSLSRWAGDPLVNLVVPGLFVTGGLGYVVLGEMFAGRRWRAMTLHTKLMLSGTAALVVWSLITFLALEWTNPATLGGLDGTGAKLWAGWFQALTPRTAGFNTLDIGSLQDSTALMTMTLMVVGAGSTSTAGGIKVTTFIVLLLATAAFLRRRNAISAFGRSLPIEQVLKVLALAVLSVLIVLIGLFLVTLTNEQPFIDLAFEAASAFGTVGLMFVGRVGPLALGFFLATRSMPRVRYPSSDVFIG
jgi:trk system potassium uptake protein TrkH